MATTAVLTSDVAASVEGPFSSTSWSGATNGRTSNNSYATSTPVGGTQSAETDYLQLTDYDVGLPTNASNINVEVQVEAKADGASVTIVELALVVGGVITGTTPTAFATGPLTTSDATYTSYFTSTGLTAAQVNATDFGVAVRFRNGASLGTGRTVSVDAVSIVITYDAIEEAASTASASTTASVVAVVNVPAASTATASTTASVVANVVAAAEEAASSATAVAVASVVAARNTTGEASATAAVAVATVVAESGPAPPEEAAADATAAAVASVVAVRHAVAEASATAAATAASVDAVDEMAPPEEAAASATAAAVAGAVAARQAVAAASATAAVADAGVAALRQLRAAADAVVEAEASADAITVLQPRTRHSTFRGPAFSVVFRAPGGQPYPVAVTPHMLSAATYETEMGRGWSRATITFRNGMPLPRAIVGARPGTDLYTRMEVYAGAARVWSGIVDTPAATLDAGTVEAVGALLHLGRVRPWETQAQPMPITAAAALVEALREIGLGLVPMGGAEFENPGATYALQDFVGQTPLQIIDRLALVGSGEAAYHAEVYEDQSIRLRPQTITSPRYALTLRAERDTIDPDGAEMYGRIVATYLGPDGTVQRIAVTNPRFAAMHDLPAAEVPTRWVDTQLSNLSSARAYAEAMLAEHEGVAYTLTITRTFNEGVTSAIGSTVPPYVVRAGEDVTVRGVGDFPVARTAVDMLGRAATFTIGQVSRRSLDGLLQRLAATDSAVRNNVNPNTGAPVVVR